MEDIDVYNELAIDLLTTCSLTMFDARKIVAFLQSEGFIDYDQLKEYYFDGDNV